uniref:VPS9 domain-containing protein n=1 Tax=Gouania willdenowi TaxID=441366 RepID=A0A8C5HTF3_GOUWI
MCFPSCFLPFFVPAFLSPSLFPLALSLFLPSFITSSITHSLLSFLSYFLSSSLALSLPFLLPSIINSFFVLPPSLWSLHPTSLPSFLPQWLCYVLPFPLQLPDAIAEASTHRQLEVISHMGQDFWSSPSGSDIQNGPLASVPSTSCGQTGKAMNMDQCSLVTPGRHGKLCFINPLFLQLEVSKVSAERKKTSATTNEPSQPKDLDRSEKSAIEVAVLDLNRRPAPSLAELDSNSSFSSVDEENDSDSDSESSTQTKMHSFSRPPLVRSRGRGGLHRMSEAFVCFFAPDKRLTRLVEELSRDRRSTFGGMVQDFLLEQRELLQGLRFFLSQAKGCLLDSGELEPLRSQLDKALIALHSRDGSSQRLTQNLLRLGGDAAMERLGVRTGVPDSRDVERVKQKLVLMQRTHSPIDKVLLLLQVCKCVQKAMGSLHGENLPEDSPKSNITALEIHCVNFVVFVGQDTSWDDFLPSLSYVIVECNRPHVLIEVEYMMELLEPSWLGGEGIRQISPGLEQWFSTSGSGLGVCIAMNLMIRYDSLYISQY